MDKRTRHKAKRKVKATRPNTKRSNKRLLKNTRNGLGNAVAAKPTPEDNSPAFQLTCVETKIRHKAKLKSKQGRLMVLVEEPTRLTLSSFKEWSSFSVTLDEFIEYWKQGTSFAKCICILYREVL